MPKNKNEQPVCVFWFRRDLRLHDNHALFLALKAHPAVLPVFIFDTDILNKLDDQYDRRVDFIHQALQEIKSTLNAFGADILCLHNNVLQAFSSLVSLYHITDVYCNHDYEPSAIARDAIVNDFLKSHGIAFHTAKDQVIFEKNDVLKDDGKPYTIFTPYSRKWKSTLKVTDYSPFNTEPHFANFLRMAITAMPTLAAMGFTKTDMALKKDITVSRLLLEKYKSQRDIPSIAGTSKLSVYLRFGLVSVRALVQQGLASSETWLNELIWREFYMMILWHFPHVVQKSFKPMYDKITWLADEQGFARWCEGNTGFPMVDAGMRELNSTGFMHNRVRMIVSSFLVKDLLIDWRWGEAYFAKKLNDFDLSANNGGWQWAAGCGCDAAPYFRIFNPTEQQKKFDPEFKYITQWIPEFGTPHYTNAIIDHAYARTRTLNHYKRALSENQTLDLFDDLSN